VDSQIDILKRRCHNGRCSAKNTAALLQDVAREVNAAVLEAINASGEAFMIHTELGGEFTMRLAVGATNQQVCYCYCCPVAADASYVFRTKTTLTPLDRQSGACDEACLAVVPSDVAIVALRQSVCYLLQRRHIDAAWALICRETERQLGRLDTQVVGESAAAM
jgi:hypothetical protein